MRGKVLIVEDDALIMDMIRRYLEKEGFKVFSASTGESAKNRFPEINPDVVILDLMLPDEDGFELCKSFSSESMVLILTAKEEPEDRIVGLEIGADDYMTKPFNMRELIARVKALMRRRAKLGQGIKPTIKIDVMELDNRDKSLYVRGVKVELTFKEFQLLQKLFSSAGRVVSREELVNELYGFSPPEYERIIDTYVYRIRTKIMEIDSSAARRIKTVRGFGYKVE